MIRSVSHPQDNGRHKQHGFTLIELLIVIAIIGILAAILFPTFARARESARRLSCQSNLKQISLGIQQYVADYDQRYPLIDKLARQGNNPSVPRGWAVDITPYIKNTQIFQCPSEAFPVVYTPFTQSHLYSDYWLNSNLMPRQNAGIKQAAIASPSVTILSGDGTCTIGYSAGPSNAGGEGRYEAYGPEDAVGGGGALGEDETGPRPAKFQHLEGANYAFLDGHVKWLKPEKLSAGFTNGKWWAGAGPTANSSRNLGSYSATFATN